MGTAGKAALRARLLAARRAVADDVRAGEARALQHHLGALAVDADTVCAYVPVGSEPGMIAMLDVLLHRDLRVLLPVARTTGPAAGDVPLPLRWGEYRPGRLVTARFGLLEPPEPWLPESALTRAGAVLVPALAVDARGVRLGRGGGFYDRSLALADPRSPLIAVVRDEELLGELPCEAHDVRMTHVLTPAAGVVAVGAGITPPE